MDNMKEMKIAVVGVSNIEEKFGFKIFCDLIKSGYNVEGINPRDGEIMGKKIYRNLGEIESPPDLVITVVPSRITEAVVEDCKELGIKKIWMQPGSESEAAIKKAKDYGMEVTYNACFMRHSGIW